MPLRLLVTCAALAAAAVPAYGQLAVPAHSSRPGAAYTLYLNFGGFNYTGTWFGDTPGNVPAYNGEGVATSFTTAELANIKDMWSRTAEKYSAFNINVTTVDPAVNAQTQITASNFTARQNYYDSQARVMHTVIGGNGSWYGGAVGVSAFDVAESAVTVGSGLHTNWSFPTSYVNGAGTQANKRIAETNAHEIGHALALEHQGVLSGTSYNAYDPGTGTGAGSRSPIMGNSDFAERGLWRRGLAGDSAAESFIQNDVAVLLTNAGIAGNGVAGFMDSGKGHLITTATPLTFTGTAINSSATAGIITPNTSGDPNPLGELNYTTDYFTFTVGAGGANLAVVLRSGRSTITTGVADPGAMLDATLRLLDASGLELAISNSGVFAESITRTLTPGQYYLRVTSAGADAQYFDMGSYFLTGTLTPVPEPGAALAASAVMLLAWRVRRRAAREVPASRGRESPESLLHH